MGTIAEKLTYLGGTKSAIRDAIVAKGVAVPVETTFRNYATKIADISGGGGSALEWTEAYWQNIYDNSYSRPVDWLDIITPHPLVQGDQKFVGLHAVYNHSSNFCALLCTTSTGQYRVNWGDGTTSDHNSGTTAYKILTYSDFSGTDTSRGYRQAIITIVPLTGNLLTVDLYQKHNQSGLVSGYSSGWLDIRIAGNFIAGLVLGNNSTNIKNAMIEQFEFVGTNVLTTCDAMFSNCQSLLKIIALYIPPSGSISFFSMFSNCYNLQTIPLLNTVNASSMTNMFNNCYILQTIPLLDTAIVTTMNSMFYKCRSMETIPLLNTVSVTNMSYMFADCHKLQTIPLLNTVSVNNMTNMFNNCYILQTIPLLNTAIVTAMGSMFYNCYSMETIPLLDTAIVTNMGYAFANLIKLQTIPLLNTVSVINMYAAFSNCYNLQTIPLLNTAIVTDMTYVFYNCYSLQNIPLLNTASVTSLPYMFANCNNLQTIPNMQLTNTTSSTSFINVFLGCNSLSAVPIDGIKNDISFADCKLGQVELVDIFNRLPTPYTGKFITITGNFGASLLTTAEREIVTVTKGGSIIG